MIDLELSEKGDIVCDVEQNVSQFKLSFMLSEYKGQVVQFLSIPKKIPQNNGYEISFKYINPKTSSDLQSKRVENTDEIIQALNVALRTELGDVHDESIGSEIYKNIHNTISSNADTEKLCTIISNVVNDYFTNVSVTVTFKDDTRAGNFRYQTIVVRIEDSKGKLITEFVF